MPAPDPAIQSDQGSTTNAATPDPLSEAVGASEMRPLRRALLRWYGRSHRALPWRAPPGELPDPYHTLVSEAMLQQTQVATVVGYFERFMAAFPTVEALADAEEQRVLRLWQGLGYYRRARHLHRAARQIVDEYSGRVPDRVETLLKLPGVGRYTAGAIASIAHGQPEPVVDGNVARVIGRLMALDRPIDDREASRGIWASASALHKGFTRHSPQAGAPSPTLQRRGSSSEVSEPCETPSEPSADDPAHRFTPGDLNQALMELGARICTAKAPSCLLCPVQPWCAAARTGQPERYPPPKRRAVQREVTHRVIAVRRGGKRLFVRRPDSGLWAGLWQLPTWEGEPGEADPGRDDPSADGLADWVREHFGPKIGPARLCGTFTHQTTHRRIRFEVWEAAVQAGRLRPNAGVWRRPDAVDDLPLANPQRRALQLLTNDGG